MAELADDHLRARSARSPRPAFRRDRPHLHTATREAAGTGRNHAPRQSRARGRTWLDRKAARPVETSDVDRLAACHERGFGLMPDFGVYQNEIYLAGLSGRLPAFPMRFDALDATAH